MNMLDSLVQRHLEARETTALPFAGRDAFAVLSGNDLVVDGRERPDRRVGHGLCGQGAELVADDVVREVVHVLRGDVSVGEGNRGERRTRSFLS